MRHVARAGAPLVVEPSDGAPMHRLEIVVEPADEVLAARRIGAVRAAISGRADRR